MADSDEAMVEREAEALRRDIDRLRAQHERTERAIDAALAALRRLRDTAKASNRDPRPH